MSAYSRTELQKVFDQVDELRHIKKVSPMEFSKITLDLLGPPPSLTSSTKLLCAAFLFRSVEEIQVFSAGMGVSRRKSV